MGPERADDRDSASSGTRYLTIGALAVSLAVLALGGCGGEEEPQGAGTELQGPSVSTPSDIVALMNTPRLTSLSSAAGVGGLPGGKLLPTEQVVTAEGQATTAKGDYLRTWWFTTVGALACAQELGGSFIIRKVFHGMTLLYAGSYVLGYRGRLVSGEQVGTLADPAPFLSEDDLNAYALRHADAAGLVVEEVNYVPFVGGTAEFVLRPTDESELTSESTFDPELTSESFAAMREFTSEWRSRMYLFVRDLQSEQRPYLVTIVDSSGTNRLISGYFSLGEGTKEGIAWANHPKICLGHCYPLQAPPLSGS